MKNFLLGLSIMMAWTSIATAKPIHKKALAEYFGPLLAKKLNDCTTCHLPPPKDGDQEERPHNAFGTRMADLEDILKKAGKKTDIPTRLETIANEDSDGDGVSNLLELITGHYPGDANDKPTAAELKEADKKLADLRQSLQRARWSPFEPVQRPAPPSVKNQAWVRNPVDAFVAADHERLGLKPRPEAARHVLVRRAYLDLIGLPPTREELERALNDKSADWYEKMVEQLLSNPRYGERWGRHWMDVWRYSDWAGYGNELRESQRHIWHWRDWIIESLNEDKGYDRMVLEMLAGDEIAPTDPKTLRATGFLVRSWYVFNRNTWMENVVEHTSKSFLGMTMNCARCHDHFFDAITQQEYYQFRAFFEPYHVRTDRIPGEPDLNKNGIPRAFDAFPQNPTHLFVRGNEANPDKSKSIPPGVPVLFGGSKLKIEPVNLPQAAYQSPDKRDFVIQETLAVSAASIPKATEQLAVTRKQTVRAVAQAVQVNILDALVRSTLTHKALEAQALADLEVALVEAKYAGLTTVIAAEQLEDAGKVNSEEWKQAAIKAQAAQRQQAVIEARKNQLLAQQALAIAPQKNRGDAAKKLDAADKALAKAEAEAKLPAGTAYVKRSLSYPQAMIGYNKAVTAAYPQTSTGRRLALARWIADRQNPLTGRVAVNHIWLRHFGKPIVPSVFDFGKNGQPPINPPLLDWLAAEFMEPTHLAGPLAGRGPHPAKWSMKHLHRLIVTSNAYRMDSAGDPANATIDSENKHFWRMNPRRVEAEIVRDCVLHAAGNLDTTMGGPDIDQNLALSSNRRSIYYRHAPEKVSEFLATFDAANVTECYERSESIVPQQALALANSALVLDQARLLARKLAKEVGEQPQANAAFIAAAFEQILGRPASAQEKSECERFLTEQATLLADAKKLTVFTGVSAPKVAPAADPHLRAREDLIQVLLNHNDFVTIR